MINIDELKTYKKQSNLNLRQTELNYIHIAILYVISRHYSNKLVFKGGTCLMLAYNLDRFSTDLDFDLLDDSKHIDEELEKIVQKY